MAISNPPITAVPTLHHTTHETGGADVVAAIDGSVITTGSVAAARGGTGTTTGLTVLNASNVTIGTLPDAQLSTNIPRLNISNSFTGVPIEIKATNPYLTWFDTTQPSGARVFIAQDVGQSLTFSSMNDTYSTYTTQNILQLNRLGDVSIGRDVFEKGRTSPMGHWIAVPFNASNFTGATGTWTVAAGNILINNYTLIGKTMLWSCAINGSTVTGVTGSVSIALPIYPATGVAYSGVCKAGYCTDSAGAIDTFISISGTTNLAGLNFLGRNPTNGVFTLYFSLACQIN